jgi:hypothetical protein
MSEVNFTLEDRYMTRAEAMAFLHVGKDKFTPYERVKHQEGKDSMFWLHDLVAVQQAMQEQQ